MKKNTFSIICGLLTLAPAQPAMSQGYNVCSFSATRHEITAALDATPSESAARLLAPYSPAVDSLVAPVLGRCEGGMTVGRPESPLSNYLADVLRSAYRADVGLYNMGGIRSVMPAGSVTQGHIYEIAPFENYLCQLTMRGDDLLELCHNIASTGGEGISGLRIVATRGGELVSALVLAADGSYVAIEPEREYTVATLDYLAAGNDKMTALKRALRREDTKTPVRELIMETIKRQGVVSAGVEGRLTIVESGSPAHPAPPYPTRRLRILHTNDTHSQILPYNPHSTNREMADKGGYLRRAAFVDGQRRLTPDLLLFDAGDFSQGSVYYNLYRGDVEMSLMSQMRYDACTIGNHEFDFGLENMARLFRKADFPVVCCNYDFSGTVCEGLVRPYTVIERAGLRIGVTGVGCALEGMVAAKNCVGVVYSDPRESLPPVVERLRSEERCDLVILLSHTGWGIEEMNDAMVVEATRGIDLVIGGHSHTYMELPQWVKNADGISVPVYQMGKSGRFVGEMSVECLRSLEIQGEGYGAAAGR